MNNYLTNLAVASATMAMIGLGFIALAHGCLAQDELNRAVVAQHLEVIP